MSKDVEKSARGGKLGQMRWMFNRIAPSYDFLNHLFTLNIDQLWRRRLARMVAQERPKQVLDLATGTADLAIALARKLPEAEILGLDISTEMMAVGEKKICKAGLEQRITLDEGNAEALTQGDESFDAVTVGFGVRNFDHLAQCFAEMHRVVRSEGRVAILELSTPRNRFVRAFYNGYAHHFMPWLGGLISHDKAAYRYLPASISAFHRPERVVEMLTEAGFKQVEAHKQLFGIAYIYLAVK